VNRANLEASFHNVYHFTLYMEVMYHGNINPSLTWYTSVSEISIRGNSCLS